MLDFLPFILTVIAAVQAPIEPVAQDFEVLTSINIRPEPSLSGLDLTLARKYAHCLTSPRFPTEDEFSEKTKKCNDYRTQKMSADLQKILDHLEHIVRNSPGSEASLTVAGDDNAPYQ